MNLGLSVGFSMLRRFSLTYAADLRFGYGPVFGFIRIERHRNDYFKYLAGAKAFHPPTGAELEAGVAFSGPHEDGKIQQAWGAHLAVGRWSPIFEAQLQGMVPFVGDSENYDLGVAPFFSIPGNAISGIGCGAD